MVRISDILDTMLDHNPLADTDIVERAYIYSARVHEGQMRLSGEPYLSHPLEVASILASMKLDGVCVAAGLLHDVLEDTHATDVDIKEMFGDEVLHIVQGLTKLSKLTYNSAQTRQAESIRKMILAMADDIRVILIKLVDRLHNMRTLEFQKEHKKKRIAQETMEIYAPIASRLGIYWIKHELEDIGFKTLDPEEYETISANIRKDADEREEYVAAVRDYLEDTLKDKGLPCQVLGRHKQVYSIYQKMKKQELPFEEIYDIIAFRIILDTVPQCYEALGIVHSMWRPIAKKFKDYIAVPKANMYQSLHTSVFGPFGERAEIQIRTREMDQVATSGIAAHWSYKEGKGIASGKEGSAYAWIQSLLETQQDTDAPAEFLENVRLDLFSDEVHVYTPAGEIRSLIAGSTPVDFAYMIHTDVGDHCVGAKVNRRITPLSRPLVSGDIVEIITSAKGKPSKDWLNFVKTPKARSKIRRWIKSEERDRSLHLGREMCEKFFRKYRINFNELVKSEKMEEVADAFGFKTVDDLLEQVGYGKITPRQVVQKILPKAVPESGDSESFFNRIIGRVKKKRPVDGVVVHGVEDVLVRFAKCCQPVPGDAIAGYITRGSGVTVHRANCVNVLKVTPERQVSVQWADAVVSTYPVRIRIHAYDKLGLLADISSAISQNGANILAATTETGEDKVVETHFTLAVDGIEQLEKTLVAIKKIKSVFDVRRIGT